MTEKPLNLGVLLKKRVSVVCSTLRSRSLDYKHRLIQEVTFHSTYSVMQGYIINYNYIDDSIIITMSCMTQVRCHVCMII